MSKRDGGEGKIRLIGLVAFAACVVEGYGRDEAVKERSVEGSLGVNTTVLASEVISGGVNEGGMNSFQEGYVVNVIQLQRRTKRVRNKSTVSEDGENMDHDVFVDRLGVDPEMKIGDNKGGVGILYKEVVEVANSSFKEKMWSSTIEGIK